MARHKTVKEIALLGGTFDPIHKGHVDLANRVLEWIPAEKIYLCPARQNPLKHAAYGASPEHRRTMVELALAEEKNPRLKSLDFEVSRKAPSYTLHTVEFLRETEKANVTLVMGGEVFETLPDWYEPKKLLESASILVITREGKVDKDAILRRIGALEPKVQMKDFSALPYSATQVREALKRTPDICPEALAKSVYSYIKVNALYSR